MQLYKKYIKAFIVAMVLLSFSCKTVKPYQRVYLNDDAMQIGKRPSEQLSSSVHNYREGASGGGSGNSSGGCGCN
jgi:hypothetical protein